MFRVFWWIVPHPNPSTLNYCLNGFASIRPVFLKNAPTFDRLFGGLTSTITDF
jgi:hypothetical protein